MVGLVTHAHVSILAVMAVFERVASAPVLSTSKALSELKRLRTKLCGLGPMTPGNADVDSLDLGHCELGPRARVRAQRTHWRGAA